MFNKLKLGPKLIGGFLIVALISASIGILGMVNLRKFENKDNILSEKVVDPLYYLLKITDSFQNARLLTLKYIMSESDEEKTAIGNQITNFSSDAEKNIKLYEKTFIDKNDEILFNKFIEARNNYNMLILKINKLDKENKKEEELAIFNNDANTASVIYKNVLDEIIKSKYESATKIDIDNTANFNQTRFLMIVVNTTAAVLALFFGIILTLSITNPMKKITAISDKMANGDLSMGDVHVRNYDETGILANSFNKMLGSLNELLSQVNANVEQVGLGANQVSEASQSLSQGATEQASSLEEITSSIQEISSQTKLNAENAINANALAKKSVENAENGNRQMEELVESMESINKSSDEIKKVVKVIDDIAFQINLLALNANVEAARAGKYGKGFAVVADEVRNLAVKSGKAVRETTQMVEESISNIKTGVGIVDVTAKQLEEIVGGAGKVADLVEEIAHASKEQSQGLEQINVALGQIDQVTQANTANAEESASSAEELSSQATQLREMVKQFKLRESKNITTTNFLDKISPEMLESLLREKLAGKQKKDTEKKTKTQKLMIEEKKVVNPKTIINLDDGDFERF
jgi:methyl-accepting chemotaxis protein